MSTTPAFLSRRNRDALRRQYKRGEKAIRVVQADLDGRVGLLAVTDRRVLFVARRALGTFVRDVPRDQVARVTQRKERYGSIVLKTKGEHRLEFWMLERGAAEAALDALAPKAVATPPPRPAAPGTKEVAFQAAARPGPAKTPASAPSTRDGSSYLPDDTTERRARLERQLERGILTKSEYAWQLESLR